MRSKHNNTSERSVWTTRGTILKNKPYLVTFQESILVSQCTFLLIFIHCQLFTVHWWYFLAQVICSNMVSVTVSLYGQWHPIECSDTIEYINCWADWYSCWIGKWFVVKFHFVWWLGFLSVIDGTNSFHVL